MKHVAEALGRRRPYLLGAVAVLASGLLATTSAAGMTEHSSGPTFHNVHFMSPPSAHPSLPSAADERQGAPPLTNHGGPIMRVERSYAIFWDPGALQDGTATQGITSTYKRLIARYFHDVKDSDFFAVQKQYDGQGRAPSITNFAASWVDRTPFPQDRCTTPDTGTNCVLDVDIQARVIADAEAHGISASNKKMFFVYTPQDEGSCIDVACMYASYSYYCAYHSHVNNAGGHLIYANMPFPTVSTGKNCRYDAGGPQQFPNDLNADAVINVTSHEQMEAITDPVVNTWYDADRYENGDECAWDFGSTLANGGDVTLNGHPYGLQKEGSNSAHNCVLSN